MTSLVQRQTVSFCQVIRQTDSAISKESFNFWNSRLHDHNSPFVYESNTDGFGASSRGRHIELQSRSDIRPDLLFAPIPKSLSISRPSIFLASTVQDILPQLTNSTPRSDPSSVLFQGDIRRKSSVQFRIRPINGLIRNEGHQPSIEPVEFAL